MSDPDIAIEADVGAFCSLIVADNQIIQFLKDRLDDAKNQIAQNTILAPVADILSSDSAKIQPVCFNGIAKIGIWLKPLQDIPDPIGVLSTLDILNGKKFGIQFSKETLDRLIIAAWNNLTRANGKVSSKTFQPDPNGDIEMKSINLSSAGNAIILTVKGVYSKEILGSTHSIDFTVTFTDILSISGNEVQCDHQPSDLKFDQSSIDAIKAILCIINPLTCDLAIDAINIELNSALGKIVLPNLHIGCMLASLIPQQILLPEKTKIDIFYDSLEVNFNDGGRGLIASQSTPLTRQPRNPTVTIAGPLNITIPLESGKGGGFYRAQPKDFSSPQFAWTADGTISNSNSDMIHIEFFLRGEDNSATRHITVKVTDTDNDFAQADTDVTFTLVGNGDCGPPCGPICRKKMCGPCSRGT